MPVYQPFYEDWKSSPDPSTPVTDLAMEHIEAGLVEVSTDLEAFKAEADTNYAPASVSDAVTTKLGTAQAARTYAPNDFLYLPTSTALLKWRTRANEAARGGAQAHLALLGDSITYGGAATGASNPKWRNSWPGRVRRHLDSLLGPGGTGMVPPVTAITDVPAYDPRWAFTGTVNRHAFGFHASACLRVTPGATVSFTADNCNEFVVYGFSGGANNNFLNTAQIDGGTSRTFKNNANSATVDAPAATGKWFMHLETHFAAGAVGTHTITLTRPAGADSDLFIWGIEARNTTLGRIRVSNLGYSSKSLASFVASDDTNGLWGLPLLDTVRADLLVVGLGINDWQGQTGSSVLTATRDRLKSIVQRQRSTGSTPGGIAHPGGDAMLAWFPQPDTTALAVPPNQNPSWDAMREVFYTVADEENVALLDLGMAWGGFTTGNSLGLFADLIHPNDKGGADIAEMFTKGLLPVSRP